MESFRLTILHDVNRGKNQSVRFLIDKSTTVMNINKQGGTNSNNMTTLTRDLLVLTMRNNITFTAHPLAREKNVVADLLPD